LLSWLPQMIFSQQFLLSPSFWFVSLFHGTWKVCSAPVPITNLTRELSAWNTGTCLYMAWTALGCLIYFINSVIWRDNAINMAPIWCDISQFIMKSLFYISFYSFAASKIIIGLSVGITASSLCINRRLYSIASVRSVTKSKAQVNSLPF